MVEHHRNSDFLHLFGPITQKRDFGQKKCIHVKLFKKGQKTYRNHKKYNIFFLYHAYNFLPFCQICPTYPKLHPRSKCLESIPWVISGVKVRPPDIFWRTPSGAGVRALSYQIMNNKLYLTVAVWLIRQIRAGIFFLFIKIIVKDLG